MVNFDFYKADNLNQVIFDLKEDQPFNTHFENFDIFLRNKHSLDT